jgi:hypothetical protein
MDADSDGEARRHYRGDRPPQPRNPPERRALRSSGHRQGRVSEYARRRGHRRELTLSSSERLREMPRPFHIAPASIPFDPTELRKSRRIRERLVQERPL